MYLEATTSCFVLLWFVIICQLVASALPEVFACMSLCMLVFVHSMTRVVVTSFYQVKTDEGTDSSSAAAEKMNEVDSDSWTVDKKLRNLLTNILVDNGKLRKKVNSVIRYAVKKKMSSPGESEMYKTSKHLDS